MSAADSVERSLIEYEYSEEFCGAAAHAGMHPDDIGACDGCGKLFHVETLYCVEKTQACKDCWAGDNRNG